MVSQGLFDAYVQGLDDALRDMGSATFRWQEDAQAGRGLLRDASRPMRASGELCRMRRPCANS